MPLLELPHGTGFPWQTFTEIRKTSYVSFLPDKNTGKRCRVDQQLILNDLQEFDNTSEPFHCDLNFSVAVEIVRQKFTLPKQVNVIHLKDIFQQDLEIWDESPGWPWHTKGYRSKKMIRDDPEAIEKVRAFWHYLKLGFKTNSCAYVLPDSCAYVCSRIRDFDETKIRTVLEYPATEVRTVLVYPANVTFAEAMFALPLIRGFQELQNGPMAYGYEPGTGGFQRIISRMREGKHFYGLDFSKFDKTVPVWLIDAAFNILALNIDFGTYQDYGVSNVKSLFAVFDKLKNYFKNTPILLSSGLRFQKTTGIASGSYFTQLVGSVCNAIILEYVFLQLSGDAIEDAIFMGDNSLITAREKLPLYDIGKLIEEKFGMKLNVEKSCYSTNINEIKFLGCTISADFPTKPTAD